jgi:hypothetical protein
MRRRDEHIIYERMIPLKMLLLLLVVIVILEFFLLLAVRYCRKHAYTTQTAGLAVYSK